MALSAMIKDRKLQNVKTVNVQAENFSGKFNKIVARAVTNLVDFLKYWQKLLKPKGKFFI
jgi:16S rRNA G527 N7-methylase RsmG